MSSETERIFSGVKLTISPTRNRLGEDIIEATECLNRWHKTGLWWLIDQRQDIYLNAHLGIAGGLISSDITLTPHKDYGTDVLYQGT
jgi:hAT family C-terminal dimerisation region